MLILAMATILQCLFLGGRATGLAASDTGSTTLPGGVLQRPHHCENMCSDKLSALVAELQAIELWDAGEQPAHEDEREARRRRRFEITREIDTLTSRSQVE
jgi:hypothetical protein